MSKLSALVVDDSKSARFFLRKALEEQQVEVFAVESGFDALSRIGVQRPDVVFMDHQMPEMDGLETTVRMRQDPATSGIPVVMCTSTDDSEFLNRVDELGALGILPKPPTSDSLRGVLNRVRSRIADIDRQAAAMEAMRVELEESLRSEIQSQVAQLQDSLGQAATESQTADWQEPLTEMESRLRDHVAAELDARITQLKNDIPEPDDTRIADVAGAAILDGEAFTVKVQGLLDAGISASEAKRSDDINSSISQALTGLEERLSSSHSAALEEGLAGLRSEVMPPDDGLLAERVRGAMLADDAFLTQLRELVTPEPGDQQEGPDLSVLVAEGIGSAMNDVEDKVSIRVSSEVEKALNHYREENPPPDDVVIVDKVKSSLMADESLLSTIRDAVTPEPESEDVLAQRAVESENIMSTKVESAVGELGGRVTGMISEELDGRMEALREELKPPQAADIADQVRTDVRSDATLVDEILDRIPEASERWQQRFKGLRSQVRQAMILQMAFSAGVAALVALAVVYFYTTTNV